ncbi:MAG: ATP-binding cassette domain-containing protein [Propionibacteriaceae bacterium]|jgi:ABC-2 type transport system ATP-binding protein|nr:ATP-binding cassette domain-containing protein [Propionibacteriaceae bacterium]
MVIFEHLTKRYGSLTAVNDLSFTVKPGRVTGFLGPNGAGKTTTLRMATGLIRPDAGYALFDGTLYRDLAKPWRKVGVAFEPVVFHPGRTALNHLLAYAPYADASRARCEALLDLVGLTAAANKRVGQFSLGMRGRLSLAVAMLGDPEILLLDEPVNGLDPEGIRWVRELLRRLASEGRTILVSSHLLAEAAQTVDEIVIIAQGKLLFQGSLAEAESSATSVVWVKPSSPEAFQALARRNHWKILPGDGTHFRLEGLTTTEIGAASLAAGIPLEGLRAQAGDLESIFLRLTEGQGGMR